MKPNAPTDANLQRQVERQRLAELIGRLLARHWLRSRGDQLPAGPRPEHRPRTS